MMGPLRGDGRGVVNERHLHEPVSLASDLVLGPFPLRERVIRACQEPGENWDPPREWSTYAIWRVDAPYKKDGTIRFDVDRRLSTAIQLSRLVRPTTLAYSRCARILEWEDADLQIIPGRYAGRGTIAFVADESQNWLRDKDVPLLRQVIEVFMPDSLPVRVKRAMMYHEYLHGVREVDVRWPLLVTALEALVHTDERKKVFGSGGMRVTDQFVKRLARIVSLVPSVVWTEGELDEAYEHRSSFAHGKGMGGISEAESLRMSLRLESGLREILLAAILTPSVASVFASDDRIRAALNPA